MDFSIFSFLRMKNSRLVAGKTFPRLFDIAELTWNGFRRRISAGSWRSSHRRLRHELSFCNINSTSVGMDKTLRCSLHCRWYSRKKSLDAVTNRNLFIDITRSLMNN
eukprot:XP_014771401.1 PREDICTED: uncharacterized protein LOC106869969 [Octopus bimaculoides]